MVAEFYIISESFTQNSKLSVREIEDRTKSLAKDFVEIKKYKETNKIYIHPDIYNVNFINDITIMDLLFNEKTANNQLDRDVRILLKKIIIEQEPTNLSTQEVIDVLLTEHNQDICHGLIGFNEVEEVDIRLQVVYNLSGWLDFRRYYLGIYPKNEPFFIDECKKYFPNLFFHERNKESIKDIFQDCPKKIVYHLTALNDKFNASYNLPDLNRTEILKHFSINARLDEVASPEGDASRKPDFTFRFLNSEGINEAVCCEPHLKLCYSDLDLSYSNERRIYFHEGKSNIHNGKILIGHIGCHL